MPIYVWRLIRSILTFQFQ